MLLSWSTRCSIFQKGDVATLRETLTMRHDYDNSLYFAENANKFNGVQQLVDRDAFNMLAELQIVKVLEARDFRIDDAALAFF